MRAQDPLSKQSRRLGAGGVFGVNALQQERIHPNVWAFPVDGVTPRKRGKVVSKK
jgi:hypothetical protein